jgi:hypothetical protein
MCRRDCRRERENLVEAFVGEGRSEALLSHFTTGSCSLLRSTIRQGM